MIKAADILTRCRDARLRLWGSDEKSRQIEEYYNSGFLPSDGCGREIQSLGLGNKELRRPHKLLRSTIEHDGGPVDVVVEKLDDFDRATTFKNALEKALGPWCRDAYRTLCAQVAGDFLIRGRAFAFRTSKRDLRFRFGRPLYDEDATTDIGDDSFVWWAFPYRLTLRDIDNFYNAVKDDEEDRPGWSKHGLKKLKKYIMLKPHGNGYSTSPLDYDKPFAEDRLDEPLNCYVYFEKSGKKDGLHRKVNMRIVSRFTEKCHVNTLESVDEKRRTITRTKKLSLEYNKKPLEEGEDQVIFSLDDAFDCVHDCLVTWMEDARISGEQLMDEVEGDGKQFLPRFSVMEELTESAVSGTGFAMRPNLQASREVPKKVLQRLQETGLPPFSVAPPGVGVLDKSGVINSSRAGLELVQALGISIAEESSTNNLPQSMGKRVQTEFAAEAQALVDTAQEAVTLRFTFWHSGWDMLWQAVGKTLQMDGWAKADPSYWEVKAIREKFVEFGGKEKELEDACLTFRSRRNPGGADKITALQRFQLILNNPNAPANWQQWAWMESAKLLFGNEVVDLLQGEQKEPSRSQIERALLQNSAALTSYLPVPPERGDDPIVHLEQVHGPALLQLLQVCQAKGFRDVNDTQGVSALIQHASFDVANLPGSYRDVAFQRLQELMAAFQQIPEQMPLDKAQIEQAKLQMEAAKTQKDIALGENLIQTRNAQLQMKSQQADVNMLAKAKSLGQQDRRIAIEEQRAMAETQEIPAI